MGESAEPGPAGLLRPAPPGNARWSFDLRRVLSRVDRVAPGRFALATILGYVALSLVAYLPAWPGDPGRLVGYQCVCGDPVQQSWFLGWMPWALLHGHNPLFTNWIDYPIGANLGVNTEMPLLGLLAAPITFAAGSVASFSFLIWLAFPSSATAAFFVLRRWTRSNVASVCGGLLYGFSPYIVGQGFQHLNLSFVPLPPLIFMALYEVVVDQRSRPRRWGAALGSARDCAVPHFTRSPRDNARRRLLGPCDRARDPASCDRPPPVGPHPSCARSRCAHLGGPARLSDLLLLRRAATLSRAGAGKGDQQPVPGRPARCDRPDVGAALRCRAPL